MTIEIPTADTIDADWITRATAEQGVAIHPSAVTVTPVGTGQLGDTFRLTLDYAGTPDGPPTLICKLAATDPTSRETARQWRLYEREVRFYKEIAPWTGMDTAHLHAAGLSEADNRFYLLLEDLAPATPGDQIRGIALPDADRAIREAARLHASTWGRGDDPAIAWLETGLQAQPFYAPEVYRTVWPIFRERYAEMLEDVHLRFGDAFFELYDSYSRPLDRPRCVTHNDFRPDNMLFGGPGGRLTTVDFQSTGLGYNAVDPAFLIGGSFSIDDRRETEDALVRAYHEELVQAGVTGYDMADLREDYRHFTFSGVNVAVGAAILVKRTERGDRLFLTMLDRHVRHALDLDSLGLLRARG